MARLVLVINSGSSSMKYQLVDPHAGAAIASGVIERIGEVDGSGAGTGVGIGMGKATHRSGDSSTAHEGPIADHAAALTIMQDLFAAAGTPLDQAGVVAIGHRVVHGGAVFGDPVIVDDEVLQQIQALSVLAPLHNPANATGIAQARAAFPGVPQVAVFDTAFFRTLPPAAAAYAIDREVAAAHQVRRYGFHGTSHQFVSARVAEILGQDPAELDQIVLHLGNGASISAIRGGVAVETSMGLTPLEGLVMGTRSGDIDPGVLFHLHRTAGMSLDDLDTLLNRRSGLLGLAGANDFRDLQRRIDEGDTVAAEAVDVYCHRARKYVGAYLAVLCGADAITFTAGVGENDARVRKGILAGLEPLGIALDDERNERAGREARIISSDGSAVTVLVVPTNEELAIARATAALVD